MWSVAITRGSAELQVAQRLPLETFCPYTVCKTRVKLPNTRRTVFKMVESQVVLWPRYLLVHCTNVQTVLADKDVHGVLRGAEGVVSILPDHLVDKYRVGCLPCGLVTKHSPLLGVSIKDLLAFVEPEKLSADVPLLFGKYVLSTAEFQALS